MKNTNYQEAKKELIEAMNRPDYQYNFYKKALCIMEVYTIARKWKLTTPKFYLLDTVAQKILKEKGIAIE